MDGKIPVGKAGVNALRSMLAVGAWMLLSTSLGWAATPDQLYETWQEDNLHRPDTAEYAAEDYLRVAPTGPHAQELHIWLDTYHKAMAMLEASRSKTLGQATAKNKQAKPNTKPASAAPYRQAAAPRPARPVAPPAPPQFAARPAPPARQVASQPAARPAPITPPAASQPATQSELPAVQLPEIRLASAPPRKQAAAPPPAPPAAPPSQPAAQPPAVPSPQTRLASPQPMPPAPLQPAAPLAPPAVRPPQTRLASAAPRGPATVPSPAPSQLAARPAPPAVPSPETQPASASPQENNVPKMRPPQAAANSSSGAKTKVLSLTQALAFIADKVEDEGRINVLAQFHDAAGDRDLVEQLSYEASGVTIDPNRCQLSFRSHMVDGKGTTDQNRAIEFRLAKSIKVETADQALTDLNFAAGRPFPAHTDPQAYVVHIARWDSPSGDDLYFPGKDVATQVADVAQHALELCEDVTTKPGRDR
jgi:hypothetical protein